MTPTERPITCAAIWFDGDDELNFMCFAESDEAHQLASDLVTIRMSAPDMEVNTDLYPTPESYLDHCWVVLSSLLCIYFDQEEVIRLPLPAFTDDPMQESIPAEIRSLLGL